MEKLPLLFRCTRSLYLTSTPRVTSTLRSYKQNSIQFLQCRPAGHSHWANVRHIKEAKDHSKMLVSQSVARRIRSAIREPGGSNPNINSKLAKVIEFGERNNVPLKSIQSMITKAESIKLTQIILEAKGPNGSLIIFDLSTPNFRKTRNEVTRLLGKRCGGSLMTEGGTRNNFERKGVISAVAKNSETMTLEEATDIAIMVNAEDVKTAELEQGGKCFEVICDPEMIYEVVKGLKDTELEVEDYNVKYLPLELVEISDDIKGRIDNAIQAVRSLDDIVVDSIFDNINW